MSDVLSEDRIIKFLDYVSKQVTSLQSGERIKRVTALSNIQKALKEGENFLLQTTYEEVFILYHKDLLVCLKDPVEKCREMSAVILNNLVSKLESISDTAASTVIGSLLMCLSLVDEREISEEIREIEIDILSCLIKLSGLELFKHLNYIANILETCIVDVSPEIKRKSCECVCDLAYSLHSHFQMVSGVLINPLLQSLTHQHWKTRVACVMAIGSVIQYGDNKNIVDVISHLAQRLFDPTPPVRAATVHVVGTWLIELQDRYSYFPRLLPLLLSSLSDEIAEVRCKALEYWQKAGEVYLEENEKDYKDQIDFPQPVPHDYPGSQPSLGCRLLVQRYFINILPALLHDLNDWIIETRVKSAQLLHTLLLHCEEKSTMKLQLFIQGILVAGKDEEKKASEMAIKSAELLGYFTEVKLWSDCILPLILEKLSSCDLAILAALIRGSGKKKFQDSFKSICNTLADQYVCRCPKSDCQANILLCVEALLLSPNEVDSESSYQLFSALISIAGTTVNSTVAKKVDNVLELLCSVVSLNSVDDLYKLHSLRLLRELVNNHKLWTSHSPEVPIFIYLVENGCTAADVATSAVSVINHNLDPDKDPKLRSLLLGLVTSMLKKNPFQSEEALPASSVFSLIRSGIFPNLTWSAGKSSAALRTIAAANLLEVISTNRLEISMLSCIGEELLTILNSLADDNLATNRLLACKILSCILPVLTVKEHSIHRSCQQFLQCLDDEMDGVRIAAITVFHTYFQSFPRDYNWAPYKSYLQHIYQNILIHMDDQEEHVRMKVFDLLKDISFASPEILLEEIKSLRDVMSATELCDKLTNHIKYLQSSKINILKENA